jgi:hypothetical protein
LSCGKDETGLALLSNHLTPAHFARKRFGAGVSPDNGILLAHFLSIVGFSWPNIEMVALGCINVTASQNFTTRLLSSSRARFVDQSPLT